MNWKIKALMILALLAIAAPTTLVFAQCTTDPGNRDTVFVIQQNVAIVEGDSIGVPIQVYNDEALGGFSLGLTWSGNNSKIEFSSAKIDPAIAALGFIQLVNTQNLASNIVGLGVINLAAGQIAASASPKTVYTVYFKIKTGATTDRFNIDSIFFPPAGPFVLAKNSGGDLCPEYKHSLGRDILLPVYESDSPVLPESFELGQNNPNPFNPSTSIDFALPKSANVKVEIFNILGQKVKTVVDEYLSAGYKKVTWDGTDNTGKTVASGVYLYRMTADDFTATKKMMLMK
ncbi:MAG: T9SS type A sorting domain-containing protein [candidate division Zixibacteria bacterium]|nr:T9SS type A sorting domain-containing protein [candidate division Zixibacteria bacterium]